MDPEIAPEDLPRVGANAIRALAMDAVQKAQSGHPGLPMGMADVATVLWSRYLHHNPHNPRWLDRDRFILSAGHGSMLLYALLHLTGYDLPMEELQAFRQLNSKTPGHPEFGHTAGVEATTGPLGQGISNAVGLALAERWMAARFNRPGHEIIDHYTYVIASDGDMQEGISHEACSLAGHLGLGRLIVFYDDNGISIDGKTELSFSEDVVARFAAYGWHTQRVDGHDQSAIGAAIDAARAVADKPSIIACKTVIGYGAPNRAGTSKAHGEPLGDDEVAGARKALGWSWPPFEVPAPVLAYWREAVERGAAAEADWNERLTAYAKAHGDEAVELRRIIAGQPAEGWREPLDALWVKWKSDPPDLATRSASGQVLDAIGMAHTDLIGGSADLTPSNNTRVAAYEDIAPGSFGGKYVRYGIREHGMGGILNGMALHGGIVPYSGTFATFSDYMRPAIRLAALTGLQVIYVFTHDSIGLGQDGPTHQPVEHYAALRAIPNLSVFRPGDARETLECWRAALERRDGPSALLLTRQKLPGQPCDSPDSTNRGGYVLAEPPNGLNLQALLLATGSEVQLAMAAREILAEQKIGARVVSLPCWESFDAQPQSYRDQVLPPQVTCRVAVEAGVTLGWERYLGLNGVMIGMRGYGGSAPYEQLYEHFGITADAVVQAVKKSLA